MPPLSDKSRTNQYIELINTKPDYIVSNLHGLPQVNQKEILAGKRTGFKSLYCEIGSGSGAHLIRQACANSESFFTGLELRYKRIFRSAEKAEKLNLKNILFFRQDAAHIDKLFENNSLSGIYINFPDPWSDKQRWKKKQLLKIEYLINLNNLLKVNGFLSYKTDHKELFAEVTQRVRSLKCYNIVKISRDLLNSQYYEQNNQTEFEQLFISKGYPIFFLFAEKVCE